MRFKLIFPTIGLLLFAGVTYSSYRGWQIQSTTGRYFWWSSLRLDSDPLNKRLAARCSNGEANCASWDLLQDTWGDPGWIAKGLMVSALPAFMVGAVIVHGLGHLGVNEVWSFLTSMPVLISAWYYFIGWLLDRFKSRRTQTA